MIDFSSRIRELRIQKQMSQVDVAKRLNVTKQAISSYENGNRYPNHEIIVSLSRLFNVSIDYLYGISDNNNEFLDITELSNTQKIIVKSVIEEFTKNKKNYN